MPKKNPEDICKCGDARRDHKDGKGKCGFNYHHFPLDHPWNFCHKFRLSYNANIAKAVEDAIKFGIGYVKDEKHLAITRLFKRKINR